MKKLILGLAFFAFAVFFSANAYPQAREVGDKVARIFLLGMHATVYSNGEFSAVGFGNRIVSGTYDADNMEITSMVYHEDDGSKTNGIITVCKKINYSARSDAYQGSNASSSKQVTETIYYDRLFSNKDYRDICGDYSEFTRITFRDGVMDGAYYYYNHVHGGNADYIEVIKGQYNDNKKEGKWYKDKTLDCAGTLNTWFEWINGSYENTTVTVYSNGEFVSEYTYDR